jgi:HEAT repeat protein
MLIRILRESQHPCHATVIDNITSTHDANILARLVEMLRDTDTPAAALDIIARRNDQQFVDALLSGLKRPVPIRVLHNMKRLSRVAWLEDNRDLLLELDGRAQATAIDLALASQLNRNSVFELLVFLLQNGLAEARRASCQALSKFDGPQADERVLAALNDPDAGVQAAAVRQLRSRHIPDALERLVKLLDSRSHEVRDAARSSLAEFNFTRYRTMFDLLDEKSARTTGVLVRKVDPTAPQKLGEELAAPSIASKLRGIEMALAMDAADDVRQQLVELARHENLSVRKEAITALARCRGDDVVAALEAAANDSNHTISDAAKQSLAQADRLKVAPTAPGVLAGETK